MNSWKTAFQLNKWEIKKSVINIMLAYLVTLMFTFFFIKEFGSYIENGTILFDLLFLLVFTSSPLFPKPKNFEVQQLQNGLFASPIVYLQKQLPIRDEVIITSRLIMHILYTFPIQLVALILIYLSTSAINFLSIGSFIAFCMIWLSISIGIGYVIPKFNIGAGGFAVTNSGSLIFTTLSILLTFGILTLIHAFFGHGIVYWSIMFANDFPLLSAGISIFIAVIGYHAWMKAMRKALKTLRYG